MKITANSPARHKTAPASMNLWSVTAMGIGAMVGAGIFALLGVVAVTAGGETYISFLLGGCVALLSAYSYAKLAERYPDAGGIVAYFDRAFGTGRVTGTLSLTYLITIVATLALVAKAFGVYSAPLAFGHATTVSIDAFASAITIALVLLNLVSSGLVGRAELTLVGIKLLVLGVLVLAGAYGMATHGLVEHAAPRTFSVISGAGTTFLAYAGFGMMTNAAGSVSDPKRTIPRAIYLAIGIVILIYVALAIVVLANVSVDDLSQNADTAVAVAARPVLGQAGYIVVSVAALLATASGINAWVFTAIQISSAMVKDNQLPQMFAKPIWRKGTLGLLLGVAVILIAINVFDLNALARIASATFLISYMAVQIAHWKLIKQTKGSRLLVAAGFLAMATILGFFLWSTFMADPWAIAMIGLFVVGSGIVETYLATRSNRTRFTR